MFESLSEICDPSDYVTVKGWCAYGEIVRTLWNYSELVVMPIFFLSFLFAWILANRATTSLISKSPTLTSSRVKTLKIIYIVTFTFVISVVFIYFIYLLAQSVG